MHWKNEPPRLASPCPRHSRLKSSRWRVRAAIDLATATASSNPSTAMATALPPSGRIQSSRHTGGIIAAGKPRSTSRVPPVGCQPRNGAATVARIRASSKSGNGVVSRRFSTRIGIRTSSVPRPSQADGGSIPPPSRSVSHRRCSTERWPSPSGLMPEKVGDLAQGDQHAGPGHETQQHRLGNVARQIAELEQGDEDLNRADQETPADTRPASSRPHDPSRRRRKLSPARALKTTSEMALVGPLMRWREEPNNEPSAVTTKAVYRPYCGGNPGDLRVGHRLRHGDGRHRQRRDQIAAQPPVLDRGEQRIGS